MQIRQFVKTTIWSPTNRIRYRRLLVASDTPPATNRFSHISTRLWTIIFLNILDISWYIYLLVLILLGSFFWLDMQPLSRSMITVSTATFWDSLPFNYCYYCYEPSAIISHPFSHHMGIAKSGNAKSPVDLFTRCWGINSVQRLIVLGFAIKQNQSITHLILVVLIINHAYQSRNSR